MSYASIRDLNSKSIHSKFVLQPDLTNRHKVSPVLKKTIEMANSIPFLRDTRNVDNLSFNKFYTIDAPTVGHISNYKGRSTRVLEKKKEKEIGWALHHQPIS
jgi:hypothetical protein